jgi:hypothetical protein
VSDIPSERRTTVGVLITDEAVKYSMLQSVSLCRACYAVRASLVRISLVREDLVRLVVEKIANVANITLSPRPPKRPGRDATRIPP